MDFEFSNDQALLRETVARFLTDRAPIRPYVRDLLLDERGVTDEVWNGLAALGVTGLLVPEAYGGAGMGMVDAAVVLEELGRFVHPGPYAASAIGAVSIVVLAGNATDHGTYLPGLAEGSTIGTVALLEPGRRNDWREPTTRARATDAGWAVSGTKVHVPDALVTDHLFVTAATPDGIGVFAVRGDADGVEITPTATVDPTRKHSAVVFNDAGAARLGGDAVAAPGAAVDDIVAEVVDRIILASILDGVGAADEALRISVEYAKERRQFDRPIGAFQAVQHLCADMLQDIELGRAAAYFAAWACDAADATERHRAVTMAKAWAGDAFYRVGASAVQVHGGIGFTWEHDVGLFYKRLLSLQQSLGSSADHLEELAKIVLN